MCFPACAEEGTKLLLDQVVYRVDKLEDDMEELRKDVTSLQKDIATQAIQLTSINSTIIDMKESNEKALDEIKTGQAQTNNRLLNLIDKLMDGTTSESTKNSELIRKIILYTAVISGTIIASAFGITKLLPLITTP